MVESSPYSWFTLAAHFFKIANALMMGSCNGVNHVDLSNNSVLYEKLNFHGDNIVESHNYDNKQEGQLFRKWGICKIKSKNKS